MNRSGRAAVLLCVGVILARLVYTGGFGYFVQQRMRWPVGIAAFVLLVLGLSEAIRSHREENRDPSSLRRSVGPYVGWLLVLPLIVLISVDPTGLGAAAASRVEAYTPSASTYTFPPLEETSGPVEMRVFEFLDRAVWDPERSLEGRVVRLEGLVVNDPDLPDGFLLTRFLVSCCAADGVPLQVSVRGVDRSLKDDTWVVVDVTWRSPDEPYQETEAPWTVEADAVSLTEAAVGPEDAYESPY